MHLKSLLLILFPMLTTAGIAFPQSYKFEKQGIFQPQRKKIIRIYASKKPARKIILFQAPLRINTDGAPNSYHPERPRGDVGVMNTVCNAISVRHASEPYKKSLCNRKGFFSEAIRVFEQWRDSGYTKVPKGYVLKWGDGTNVLAGTKNSDGKTVPCVFQSGDYAGYFGSLTNRSQGLPVGQRGECDVKNQLDAVHLAHLVLAGGKTPMKKFGAAVGDLVLAYNPVTKESVAAIIGDTGPPDNLGEGSVFMNMQLLGKSSPPNSYQETLEMSIDQVGHPGIVIAIIPGTVTQITRPYDSAKINKAFEKWRTNAGFRTTQAFIEMIMKFKNKWT